MYVLCVTFSIVTQLGITTGHHSSGGKAAEYYVMSCSTPVTSSLPHHVHKHGIWAVANLYSIQLVIKGYKNSSVHILLNHAYSMQGILESVNIGIIYSDIAFISSTNITSTLEKSWKHRCSDSNYVVFLCMCMYTLITVWLHPSVQLSNLICFILIHFMSCIHLLSFSNI